MELLKRFRQGDPEAFEALFQRFQGEVYGWIVRIVRDASVAEDLTVETFWRIYQARGRFDSEASFGALSLGVSPCIGGAVKSNTARVISTSKTSVMRVRFSRIRDAVRASCAALA